MDLVFVPLIAVVVIALAWMWWAARDDRDPVSSVDSFHRALTAMQPGTGEPSQRAETVTPGSEDEDTSGEHGRTPSSSGPRTE